MTEGKVMLLSPKTREKAHEVETEHDIISSYFFSTAV